MRSSAFQCRARSLSRLAHYALPLCYLCLSCRLEALGEGSTSIHTRRQSCTIDDDDHPYPAPLPCFHPRSHCHCRRRRRRSPCASASVTTTSVRLAFAYTLRIASHRTCLLSDALPPSLPSCSGPVDGPLRCWSVWSREARHVYACTSRSGGEGLRCIYVSYRTRQ